MLKNTKFRELFKKNLVRLKPHLSLPNTIILIGFITTVIYIFSYLIPFTDNAFVINNVRPVAALANGYITDLYVKNPYPAANSRIKFPVWFA